ncbi:MAG: hypothetical protein NVS4B12_02880 [Ktedonobacteraceae bacterium]
MRSLLMITRYSGMLVLLFLCSMPATALASGKPVHSETLMAGPYSIVVGLSADPPIVDQNFTLTVSSHEATPLSGMLIAQPGPGTDAIPAHTALTANIGNAHVLTGTLHLIVRGVWKLVLELNGLRGRGVASLDVTVTAPNAIPVWLGWLIGLLPLVGCIWLIWQQWHYRDTLLKKEQKTGMMSQRA